MRQGCLLNDHHKEGALALFSERLKNWRYAWDPKLGNRRDRFYAHFDMWINDHGFSRVLHANRHIICKHAGLFAERSAHPTPMQVQKAANRGIKTIVNLRGEHILGASLLSKEAADKSGIATRYLKLRSRDAPEVETILEAKRLFDEIEYPVLFHCKSGADRAGLAAALFVLLKMNGSAGQALKQLSLRYGHIRQAKTGLLDKFLENYRAFNHKQPIDFLDWVQNHYDREQVRALYKPRNFANFSVDVLLRRE